MASSFEDLSSQDSPSLYTLGGEGSRVTIRPSKALAAKSNIEMNGSASAYSTMAPQGNGKTGGIVLGHPFARGGEGNGQSTGSGDYVGGMYAAPSESLPQPLATTQPLNIRKASTPSISSMATDRTYPTASSTAGPQPISPRSSSLTSTSPQPQPQPLPPPRSSSTRPTPPSTRIPSRHLLQSALDLAQRAVDLDRANDVQAALSMYREAVTRLRSVMIRVGIELGPVPPGLGLGEVEEAEADKDGRKRKSGLGRSEEEGKTLKGIHDAYIARIGLLSALESPQTVYSDQSNAVASSSGSRATTDSMDDCTPRGSIDSEDTGAGIGRAMSATGGATLTMQPFVGNGKGKEGERQVEDTKEEMKALTGPPVPKRRVTSLSGGLNTLAESPVLEEEEDRKGGGGQTRELGSGEASVDGSALVVGLGMGRIGLEDLASPVDPEFVPPIKLEEKEKPKEKDSGPVVVPKSTSSPRSSISSKATRWSGRLSLKNSVKQLGLDEELGEQVEDEEVDDDVEGLEGESASVGGTPMLSSPVRKLQQESSTAVLRSPSFKGATLFQRRRGNDSADMGTNGDTPLPDLPINKLAIGSPQLIGPTPTPAINAGQIKSAALERSDSAEFDLPERIAPAMRSRSLSQPGEKPTLDRLQADLPPPPPLPTLKPPAGMSSLSSSRSLASQASGVSPSGRQGSLGETLFTHMPESPLSTVTFNLAKHSPLPSPSPEATPALPVHRPFHLLRLIRNTIISPTGGFLSERLHIPRTLWTQSGVKLPSLDTKVRVLELLSVNILSLARPGELLLGSGTTDALLAGREFARALEDFEGLLEEVTKMSSKKLGVNGAGLAIKSKKAANSGISAWGGKFSRSLDRMTNGKNVDSPAAYVDSISRLCLEAQVIDQHLACLTGSQSTLYRMLPPDLRSLIENRLSRTSDFFASVVLVFILQDVNSLLSRYLKLSSRYLDD